MFNLLYSLCRPRRLKLLSALLALALLSGCREEPWDPEVAVIVNGRPIPKTAVDRVLEWGFHPQLGKGGEIEGAVTIHQILDKLIDEDLILAEAEKAGLVVSEAEADQAAAALGSAWFGVKPPPAEFSELRQALRNQLVLRKMTEKVMTERRVLSADQWREFWAGWPKKRTPKYLARVLLLPPSDQPPVLAGTGSGNLDKLAEEYEKSGLAVVRAGPIWISSERLEPLVRVALENALAKHRPTELIRLAESWAVYEVLEVDRGPAPSEELKAAREAFETLAGEMAFRKWLADLKAAADIKINPALAELGS